MQVLSNRRPSFALPQLPFDVPLYMEKACFGMRDSIAVGSGVDAVNINM